MKLNKIEKFIISVFICESAGIIGSFFTAPAISGWYDNLEKPFISPPNWVFGPVWTALFFLMGVSLYLVWTKNWKAKVSAKEKKQKIWNSLSKKLWTGSWKEENAIAIFVLQLVLNVWWSVIFFGLQSPIVAFFEIIALWFAILYTIVNFYRISREAALLLLPYLIWVSFAAVLNFMFWQINFM
jgi:tryptophan-rich sensory protein